MQDFEASVEPLQDWLNRTEISVQESSARLHDLPAKRLELSKLQVNLDILIDLFILIHKSFDLPEWNQSLLLRFQSSLTVPWKSV